MTSRGRRFIVAVVATAGVQAAARAADAPHPFLLWTKQEAAALRKRIETDESARKQLAKMEAMESGKVKAGQRGWRTNPAMLNLFKYAVLGDRAAGEREKKALLGFIGARVPGSRPGNPATGNAHRRDDRTLDALRYDVLYEELTAEQRQGVADTIRYYVDHVNNDRWPYLARPRTGWLPNMQWPTVAGVHVLAAVSRDEKLIETIFNAPGGWKWYFDCYIADGQFYMEEFGKYYSNIGAMLLWCEALERLGLGKYGYGYVGKGGATMRKFLEMKIRAGLPRTERPGGMPACDIVTMGDAGASPMVTGYDAAGAGGNPWWSQSRMNGPIPKMRDALWFEVGRRRFGDSGFGYFLAQMREPGEAAYLPSLYFGLGPIDPKAVQPPAAPSCVALERGFALLRADEGPSYWEGPAPAVALQFAMYYVHYVHDCFSILNFQACNRSIYNRMGAVGRGYAGGDPWRDHVNGQAGGVVVDGLKARYVDSGEEGTKNERIRQHLAAPAKFVAVRAEGVYGGVAQERALVLTREYLLDVFQLAGQKQHVFDWHVMSHAHLAGGRETPWKPIAEIADKPGGLDPNKPFITDARAMDAGDKPWAAVLLLQPPDADPKDPGAVGVRVSMLGGERTLLVAGRPPGIGDALGVKLIASRAGRETLFAALHEPFKGGIGAHRVERFERIAAAGGAMALAVVGKEGTGIDDRILLRWGDAADAAASLAGGEESFRFTGYAYVRIGKDKVEAAGDLAALKVKAPDGARLVLNGKAADAVAKDGFCRYEGK